MCSLRSTWSSRFVTTQRTATSGSTTTGERWTERPDSVLADWQVAQVTRRPDLALATAHLIAQEYADRGRTVTVRADAWVAFNGRPRQRWIDPAVDLASLPRDSPASAYVLDVVDS